MLLESILLGILGGACGLGFAYAALRVLVAKGPDTLPRLREIGLDPLVLAFALGISLISGLLFGLIPILKYARPRVATSLRGMGRTFSQGRERHRARNTLVVVQMALALVLLISSGLMIRTFQHLRNVQPGFTHPEEILILHSMMPQTVANRPELVMHMHNEILDKLAAIPGVTSVGFGNAAPLETFLGGSNGFLPKIKRSRVFPLRKFARLRPDSSRPWGRASSPAAILPGPNSTTNAT